MKSPSGSTDDPAAEFPEDPSTSKALRPNKTPWHRICRLVAAIVRAEMEELPGGRVLCLFRLWDGRKKATFLLNELVNAREERCRLLEVSQQKEIIQDPDLSPGSFLNPP